MTGEETSVLKEGDPGFLEILIEISKIIRSGEYKDKYGDVDWGELSYIYGAKQIYEIQRALKMKQMYDLNGWYHDPFKDLNTVEKIDQVKEVEEENLDLKIKQQLYELLKVTTNFVNTLYAEHSEQKTIIL